MPRTSADGMPCKSTHVVWRRCPGARWLVMFFPFFFSGLQPDGVHDSRFLSGTLLFGNCLSGSSTTRWTSCCGSPAPPRSRLPPSTRSVRSSRRRRQAASLGSCGTYRVRGEEEKKKKKKKNAFGATVPSMIARSFCSLRPARAVWCDPYSDDVLRASDMCLQPVGNTNPWL